jgi:hypothetical protein
VSHEELERRLARNIDFLKAEFLVEHHFVKFVGDDPPLAYVMLVLIQAVHSYIFGLSREREKVVSIDRLHEIFQRQFPPVGEQSGPQLSRNKLKEALDVSAGIGYNVHRLSEDQVAGLSLDAAQEWYRIERKLPRQDLYDWICSQLRRYERQRESAERRRAKARIRARPLRKKRYRLKHGQTKLVE